MTSGKGEYWARWEQEGKAWQAIFSYIDPALASFAEANQMDVRHWHWDAPDRTLTWSSEGLHRNLHVYIDEQHEAYSVIIEGSAWLNQWDDGKGRRRWRSDGPLRSIPSLIISGSDVNLSTLFFAQLLRESFEIVRKWRRDELDQESNLAR